MTGCDIGLTPVLEGPWLYLAEMVHRVRNEYASAIAAASVRAARSLNPETRAALDEIAERLYAFAGAHQLMQPPVGGGSLDLVRHLTAIGVTLHRARLVNHGIDLEVNGPDSLAVDAAQGWRLGLIVAELITNAARHARVSSGGLISVAVAAAGDRIAICVRDSGTDQPNTLASYRPGTGTRLVDALTAEIGGTIDRKFSPAGSTVTIDLPWCRAHPVKWSTAPETRGAGAHA